MSEWISVKDKAPPRDDVLCWYSDCGLVDVCSAYVYEGEWVYPKEEITHWQPLPSPPSGEADDLP